MSQAANIDTTRLVAEIKREAALIVAKGVVAPITPDGYQAYLESGNRLVFENQYFARRRQLATLGLALLVQEGDPGTLRMLEAVMWEICNEYSWALPAHLEMSAAYGYHRNSPYLIDLFAAETAQTLSELLELHGRQFNAVLHQRVREEIERRVLLPFEERQWEWERKENNWSAVIAGSLGMTALSMWEKDSPRLNALLQRLQTSFASYLRGFGADGVCVEGVSYWAYGFGYYCYFAAKYREVYQRDSYLTDPLLKKIAAFPFYTKVGTNTFVPFSDSDEETELPSGLLSFCQQCFAVPVPHRKEASSLHDDPCYRWAPLYRNLIWTQGLVEKQESVTHYFPNAEWLIANDRELQMFFATKGGRNNESHNHNDSGHFVLGTPGKILLTDLGAGEYTRDYFQEETRYTILNNRSLGHSVPLVNGSEQRSGERGAKNTSFQQREEGFTFSLDLAEAYGEEAGLTSFLREWTWEKVDGVLIMRDSMHFREPDGNRVQQNFISRSRPSIHNNTVTWKGEKSEVLMTFSEAAEGASIVVEQFANHAGETETAYRLVLDAAGEGGRYEREYRFTIEKRKGGT